MGLRRHGLLVMMLGSAAWLTACGGLSSDFEGVYEIDEWTQNLAGCDSPGDSILELQAETLLYAKVKSVFGHEYLGVSQCTDIAECQADAANEELLDLFGYFFDEGSDGDGWKGYGTSASIDAQDNCNPRVTLYTLTGTTGAAGTITVDSNFYDIPPYPAMEDDEGFLSCDHVDLLEAAESEPCAGVERMHATFTADLL
jgi:hypothetical protein